jgi:xanthine dehydrogenase accessory factor
MTHEFIQIIARAVKHQQAGQKMVLATVVALDGSSYRKPGVRMLMAEDGTLTGAVSGGCVEEEIFRRAAPVFTTGKPRMMIYDGRYRLGCEGVLYILLEPFSVSDDLLNSLSTVLETRKSFSVESRFFKEEKEGVGIGSQVLMPGGKRFAFSEGILGAQMDIFCQELSPRFRLLIIGGEHDSVKLCTMASQLGWEVDVVTSWRDSKQLADFPGARQVVGASPDSLELRGIDRQTAIVLMTHSFSLDLKYLLRLIDLEPAYLGVIGSRSKRDRLHEQLMTLAPEVSTDFLERIHSPAGIDLGAITPEEIALSILAEILSTVRGRRPRSLSDALRSIPSS